MHNIKTLITLSMCTATALTLSACNLNILEDKADQKPIVHEAAPIFTPKDDAKVKKQDKETVNKQAPERLSVDKDGNLVSEILDESEKRPESVGEKLPDYASGSDFASLSCNASLGKKAQDIALEITHNLANKVEVEPGAIYIAPTVIPDNYLDCISDVSDKIFEGLKGSAFDPLSPSDVLFSTSGQNLGSSRLIPMLVRECRAQGIPYLAISIVRNMGTNPTLTVRLIRVTSGITLSQAYKKLN